MIFSGLKKGKSNCTGYEHLSDKELIGSFRTENWDSFKDSQKNQILQELENREALKAGREPAKVTSLQGDTYGGYNSNTETISINTNKYVGTQENTSYEVLDSYYHESRHACQEHARNSQELNTDEKSFDMIKVESMRDKDGHLYNYTNRNPYYDMQTNEMDSNTYAANKLMDNFDSFSSDKNYDKYLEARSEHFNSVNTSTQKYSVERQQMQNANVDRAYKNNDISYGEYAKIKNEINNSNDEKALTDSKNTEDRLNYYKENINSYRSTNDKDENRNHSQPSSADKQVAKNDNTNTMYSDLMSKREHEESAMQTDNTQNGNSMDNSNT